MRLFEDKHVTILQDGATIHLGDDVKDAAESGSSREKSCVLDTLPAHSSQLNPCEEFWSWLKHKVSVLNAKHMADRLQAADERRKQRNERKKQQRAEPGLRRRSNNRSASSAASESDQASDAAQPRQTEEQIGKQDLITTLEEALAELQHDQTLAASLCQGYINHARSIWLSCVEGDPLVE